MSRLIAREVRGSGAVIAAARSSEAKCNYLTSFGCQEIGLCDHVAAWTLCMDAMHGQRFLDRRRYMQSHWCTWVRSIRRTLCNQA